MGATRTPGAIEASGQALDEWFRHQGLTPRWWGNAPGDTYGRHDHPYRKVLFCAEGSIVFHTDEGDLELGPGDRLDIEPQTPHAATVGPEGVTCVEAAIEP